MRWGAFVIATAISILIILYEWPKMKQKPMKDKLVFSLLLLGVWVLSLFDLPQMTGPTAWIVTLFRPFGQYMRK